jgi:hypothetical protein
MSDTHTPATHATDAPGHAAEPHGLGDHGETHGHDDHGHAEEKLGPVDWTAWIIGLGGVVVGGAMWACFVVATRAG